DRSLNISDALQYLETVKTRFSNESQVYNQFLNIMKDFKLQLIDTPVVIQRVAGLFFNQPDLIDGFNAFLPDNYYIQVSVD
ncbi:PAH2 domain-containing protein, partial [Fistulina hepatica ATCC 64428]